jgi:hypothetical protein
MKLYGIKRKSDGIPLGFFCSGDREEDISFVLEMDKDNYWNKGNYSSKN